MLHGLKLTYVGLIVATVNGAKVNLCMRCIYIHMCVKTCPLQMLILRLLCLLSNNYKGERYIYIHIYIYI